jgi:hypothetical protein
MALGIINTQEDRIRIRAYQIWRARLAAGLDSAGDALSDWLAAEEEVQEEESLRIEPDVPQK